MGGNLDDIKADLKTIELGARSRSWLIPQCGKIGADSTQPVPADDALPFLVYSLSMYNKLHHWAHP